MRGQLGTPEPALQSSSALVVSVAVALGLLFGAGAFTFVYAEGDSYLSDSPEVCTNCHVMREHYDGWLASSHTSVAVCNDCHAPHDGALAKYWAKARSGLAHSWAFTTGRFPDRILIGQASREITESACRHCHAPITAAIDGSHADAQALDCLRCHQGVGHGP